LPHRFLTVTKREDASFGLPGAIAASLTRVFRKVGSGWRSEYA
jgi:hypothetical protein